MRPVRPLALSSVLLLAFGCGGGDEVDIVGDSPAEAAEEIVDAVCDHQVDCGVWEIECEFDDQGNITDCTATHVEVDRAECIADDLEDIREDLECAMPTDDEAEMINDCVNDLLDTDCVSQDEIDAVVEALERGEDPDLGEAPASCERIEPIFEGCDDDL